MIRPNMATMLGFLAFDAAVAQPVLDALVKHVADRSFNCITIDGDTSTNDSFILIASGKSSLPAITSTDSPAYAALARRGDAKSRRTLAQLIVRDGEGATKFMTVHGRRRRERRRMPPDRLRDRPFAAREDGVLRIRSESRPHSGRDRLRGRRRPRCRQDRSVSGRRAGREGRRPQSGLPRGRRPARDEEERDRDSRRARPRRRAGHRSGPAICRTTT